jgi:hypothetical protein
MGDGNRPFGIIPERQAGDAEIACLLLYSTGVRYHQQTVKNQVHETNVTERSGQKQLPGAFHPVKEMVLLHILPGPWVDRENEGQCISYLHKDTAYFL